MNFYSVFDNKAISYKPPFTAVNDAVAQRLFTEACFDTETQVSRHPNDYALYRLGSYDPISGIIKPEEMPIQIITAIAVVNQELSSSSQMDLSQLTSPSEIEAQKNA